MRVTIGGQHLKHATAKLQDGDIKRTAAEVEDGDLHVLVRLVDTIGQCGSRRLVDDTAHVETRDGTSLLGGLAL